MLHSLDNKSTADGIATNKRVVVEFVVLVRLRFCATKQRFVASATNSTNNLIAVER